MAMTAFVGIAGMGALFLSWFFTQLCRERRRSHASAARIRLLWGRNATALHRSVHKIASPQRKRVLVMRPKPSVGPNYVGDIEPRPLPRTYESFM